MWRSPKDRINKKILQTIVAGIPLLLGLSTKTQDPHLSIHYIYIYIYVYIYIYMAAPQKKIGLATGPGVLFATRLVINRIGGSCDKPSLRQDC